MSGEPLKVGDVCEYVSGCCAENAANYCGRECTIVQVMDERIYRLRCPWCRFQHKDAFRVEAHPGAAALIYAPSKHLRKKRPPSQDDAEPRNDFTPCEPEFTADLARRLNKQAVPS